MFRSSRAMPLHAPAGAGRTCIVSDWCSCHVCQPCFSNAFAHASPWWPCVHRIGAPGMLTRHVYVTFSNAFACASQCGPRLHRIRAVLLPCLSAMFQQCLCTCELVVAVCASYRCSRHVYHACLSQAQQCLCSREPVRAALASYPIGAPAMFVSHVSAMPLHMRARGGRVCIVSVLPACLPSMFKSCPAMPLLARASAGRAGIVFDWCSCHVCQPCFSNAFAHASSCWPCVHRIGAPGMFTRHVYVTPSNAFACASQCGPRLHRIRLVLLPCLSAMFQQCLCTCELVVAVCASYRCSRHVYQACLSHAQQFLCMREPVRAALASYPSGAPAMFVSHVSAMPVRKLARGGRVCIVSVLPACLLQLWPFISYNW